MASGAHLKRWFGVDLHQVFGTTTALGAGGHEPPWPIRVLEFSRNILVLVPITVTWLGLDRAGRAYARCAMPDGSPILDDRLARKPFLLLWQLGFETENLKEFGFECRLRPTDIGPFDWIPLSHVANTFAGVVQWDIGALLAIIVLTAVVHTWSAWKRSTRMRTAADVELELRRYLGDLQRRIREFEPVDDMRDLAEQASKATLKIVADFSQKSEAILTTLEQQATRAHEALERSTTITVQVHQQVAQDLSQTVATAATQFGDGAARIVADFDSRSAVLLTGLRSATLTSQEELRRAVEFGNDAARATGEGFARTASELTSRLAAEAQSSRQALDEANASARQELQRSVDAGVAALHTLADDFARTASTMTTALKAEADAGRQAIDGLRAGVSAMADSLSHAARILEDSARGLAASGSDLAQGTEQIRLALEVTKGALDALRDEARALRSAVPATADALRGELGVMRSDIQAVLGGLRSAGEAAERISTAVGSIDDRLAAGDQARAGEAGARQAELTALTESIRSGSEEASSQLLAIRDELRRVLEPRAAPGSSTTAELPTDKATTTPDTVVARVDWLAHVETDARKIPGASDQRVLLIMELIVIVGPVVAVIADFIARVQR